MLVITPKIRENRIVAAFRPLYGLPCWNVHTGWGSFLTFEFGEPYIKFTEPRTTTRPVSRRLRRKMARRMVTYRGDWHLWIYCCEWLVRHNGRPVASSVTKWRMTPAARELDGQILEEVTVEPETRRCVFTFDLGGTLETFPYDNDEQWSLFEPSGTVFSYRADGLCSRHPDNIPIRDIDNWRSIYDDSETANLWFPLAPDGEGQ